MSAVFQLRLNARCCQRDLRQRNYAKLKFHLRGAFRALVQLLLP